MAVAALLHPQVCHAQGLAPKSFRPEEVAVSLKHADDVIIADLLHTHKQQSRSETNRHNKQSAFSPSWLRWQELDFMQWSAAKLQHLELQTIC